MLLRLTAIWTGRASNVSFFPRLFLFSDEPLACVSLAHHEAQSVRTAFTSLKGGENGSQQEENACK